MYPNTKIAFFIAIVFATVFITTWEMYWRYYKLFTPVTNDTKDLWAALRSKVDKLESDDILILGSSRIHYGFQMDEWEALTGKRPIMLATPGKSPGPILKDIIENTSFNGTIYMGCTPGLFFAPKDSTGGWKRATDLINYCNKQTYAQKFNQKIYSFFDPNFVFVTTRTNKELSLKGLINKIPFKRRLAPPKTLPPFSQMSKDRSIRMRDVVVQDTAYAAKFQKAWTKNIPKPEFRTVRHQVLGFYKNLVDQFEERGGHIIFIRFPSHNKVRENEKITNPRNLYWNKLIDTVGAPGYHFEDYEILNQFFTPDWSHLSTPDATVFTNELFELMQADNNN